MEQFIPSNTAPKKIVAPASKSYAQRALYAATLCPASTKIIRAGESDDVKNVTDVCKQLGAIVEEDGEDLILHGSKFPNFASLNVGESGLGIRLLAGVLACKGGDFNLLGEGSLKKRDMSDFRPIMKQLNVRFYSNEGGLPLRIDGYAKGGLVVLDGSKSSQYLSGLLMGLPLVKEDSTLEVASVKSKPYVDMTIDVLQKFGIEVDRYHYESFKIRGRQAYQSPGTITVEGDYSGMGNFVVLGAIGNGCTIRGLRPDSIQADAAILGILEKAGGTHQWQNDDLLIPPSEIQPFQADLSDCPDLFPPLVVLAAATKGPSTLLGAFRLINKESNRAEVLQTEFGKLGLKIEIEGNNMIVHGTGKLQNGTIHSNNDHRIAMAGGIAAILTEQGVTVEHAQAVSKSFPSFWECLMEGQ